ncbi:TonB-dependent receptor [Sphingomonas sp. AR_OL41]|uniref:TonB-dependent receptor n=1 Tax=Sphingomonas sp. AR_OL41 TaxID=3042729 RepID=UPI0024817999|nr:TonB-dependent receptor [Sphingomonas sp. AR_OL41]MDH7973908.1 TonB-dependent receptor [Sphingomonas sp. AR_OL41]
MKTCFLMGSVCLVAMAAAAPAIAQDKPAPSAASQAADAAPAEDKDIVVTGFRRSLAEALDVKRLTDQFQDSIVATDVAKLPDNNIAESLQRVSGVQIRRALGEGTSVSIRGLRQNRTEINGRTLVNPNGRGVGIAAVADSDYGPLSLFPSELIGRLDVIKLQGAERTDGSLSGTVDIITRKPFDKRGQLVSVSGSSVYSDQDKRWGYDGSALYSNTFANDTFGILLNATYSNKPVNEDSFNSFTGYTPLTSAFNTLASPKANDPNGDGIPGTYIADFRFQRLREKREKIGGNGAFQWRPTDNFELYGDAAYSHLKTTRTRDWFSVPLSSNAGDYASYTLSPNEILTSGVINQVAQGNAESLRVKSDTISSAIGFKWSTNDGRFTAHPEVNYSRATMDVTQEFVRVQSISKYLFAFDVNNGGIPKLTAPATLNTTDPTQFRYSNVFDNFNRNTGEETAGKIDFSFKPAGSFLSRIDAGMRYSALVTTRATVQNQVAFGGTTPANTIVVANGPQIYNVRDYTGLLGGGAPAIATRYLDTMVSTLPVGGACNTIAPNSGLCPAGFVDPLQSFRISEKTMAAYLKVNFATALGAMPLTGNVGIRYTDTARVANGAIKRASGLADPLTVKTSSIDWLPSAVAKLEITDKLLFRVGYAKVLGLPDSVDLSPNLTLNRLTPYNGNAGNPQLQPLRADQFDASLEWYFARGSALTVGAFYKDVKTFIFNKANYEIPLGEVAPPGQPEGYLVTRPLNGNGGKVKGVEVLFQTPFYFLPSPFDGFGVVANFSYIDSSTSLVDRKGQSLPFQGLSKINYNLVAYFEKYGFGARVAYNYRDKFFDSVGPGSTAIYYAPFRTVDASIRYEFGHFTIFADASNLTNEVQRRYVESPEATSFYGLQGRRFSLGFNAKF